MVRGCMFASGVRRLHIIDGTIKATKYITILQKRMLLSVQQLFQDQLFFQDD